MPAPTLCAPALASVLPGPEETPVPPTEEKAPDLILIDDDTPKGPSAQEAPESEQTRPRSRGRSRPMNYLLKWPRCVVVDSATTVYGASASETSSATSSAGEATVPSAKRRGRKRKHPEKPLSMSFSENGAFEDELGVLSSADSSFNASWAAERRTKRRRKMGSFASAAAASLAGAGVVRRREENLDPLAPPPPAPARVPNLHGVVRQLEERLSAAMERPFAYAWDEEARKAGESVDARREAYRAGLRAAASAAAKMAAEKSAGSRRRRSAPRVESWSASAGESVIVPRILATKANGQGHAVLVAWD